MKRLVTLAVVGMVAVLVGVGCKTTGGCGGKCKKAEASASACVGCKAAPAAAKCAKCNMDVCTCKAAAPATK